MRSLLLLAVCVVASSAKTVVFVTNGQPYKVTATWDPALISDSILMPMLQCFFSTYPNMVQHYNKNALQSVTWTFDPNYKGVAATGAGTTTFSTDYYRSYTDVRVVMHESMHIVQAYPTFAGAAGWLTEGIADFGRDQFGGNWNYDSRNSVSLPNYAPGQSYTQGYGVTAAFLKYLEKTYPGLVLKLDSAMRNKTYSANTWNSLTGKNVDQLWAQYASANGKRKRRSVDAEEQGELEVQTIELKGEQVDTSIDGKYHPKNLKLEQEPEVQVIEI